MINKITGVTMTTFLCSVLLTIALSGFAQSPATDIRATGEYTQTSNDTPGSTKQLALVDAERKALDQTRTHLGSLPEVKALQLTAIQTDAYVAAVFEVQEQAARTPTVGGRTVHQVDVIVKLDNETVRRFSNLRKDREVTSELLEIWKQSQELRQQLAEQNSLLAKSTAANASKIAQERDQTLAKLHLKQFRARIAAALAKTEESPFSRRVTSVEGRDRAKRLADEAIALAPDSPDARSGMGDVLMELENARAAEVEYRKALLENPNSGTGHLKIANALRLQRKFPEAIVEFKEALRINPNHAQSHSDLGLALNTEGNAADALLEFREAIRLDPDSIDGHNGVAMILASQGKIPAAVDEFREIVRIDPDLALGHYNLSIALADMDLDSEAAAELREVVRINPNHYNAHYNLGELFRLEAKYDDAARQFREYLRLAPETPQTQRNRQRARSLIQSFEDQ